MLVGWVCGADGMSDTYGSVVEPSEDKVVIPLDSYGVRFRGAVGFEIVPAILECDASPAFEHFVVPFGDFGVGK